MLKRTIAVVALSFLAGGSCIASPFSNNIFSRKDTAAKARTQMVGMTKADILSCMGVPDAKESEGDTEVWAYGSGGRTDLLGGGVTNGTVTATSPGQATVSANTSMFATKRSRYCKVSVVLVDGKVSRVNYSGPTGGFLSKDEQCAYAVEKLRQMRGISALCMRSADNLHAHGVAIGPNPPVANDRFGVVQAARWLDNAARCRLKA